MMRGGGIDMPEREEVGRGLVGGGGAMVMIVESWSREG